MTSDSRPCVLVAVGRLEVGGAEGQILEVCRALAGEFRFEVVTMGEEGPLAADLRSSGAQVHTLGVGGRGSGRGERLLRLVSAVPRLRSLLSHLHPDVIHAYLAEMSVTAAASRWPRRWPPLILSKRSLVRWIARDPIYFPLARWMNRQADVILVNSDAVRRDTISKEAADPERVRVIYNGVDTERFHPGPPEEALARELDLPAGVPVVGMVANLHRYKGHAELIQATAKLRAEGLRFNVLFVGREGDASEDVRRLIGESGLTGSVRFTGPRPDIPRLLRLLDVFVSASHEEGFSNSILEAMASGRAIVATAVGGTLEQIEDGVTGLVVPPGQPEGFAAALFRLFRQDHLRSRLGAAARETVRQRFSLDQLSKSMAALYRTVIVRTRGSGNRA